MHLVSTVYGPCRACMIFTSAIKWLILFLKQICECVWVSAYPRQCIRERSVWLGQGCVRWHCGLYLSFCHTRVRELLSDLLTQTFLCTRTIYRPQVWLVCSLNTGDVAASWTRTTRELGQSALSSKVLRPQYLVLLLFCRLALQIRINRVNQTGYLLSLWEHSFFKTLFT